VRVRETEIVNVTENEPMNTEEEIAAVEAKKRNAIKRRVVMRESLRQL
jgi:hypothetical protein